MIARGLRYLFAFKRYPKMIEEQTFEVGKTSVGEEKDNKSQSFLSKWTQQLLAKLFHWDTGPFQGF